MILALRGMNLTLFHRQTNVWTSVCTWCSWQSSIGFKTGGQEIKAVYNYLYSTTLYILNPRQTFAGYHLLNMLLDHWHLLQHMPCFSKYKTIVACTHWPDILVCMPRFLAIFLQIQKMRPFAVMYLVVMSNLCFFEIKKYPCTFLFLQFCVESCKAWVVSMAIYVVMGAYDTYRFVAEQSGRLSIKNCSSSDWRSSVPCHHFGLASLITLISWPYASSSFFKHFRDIMRTSRDYPWHGSTLTHGTYMQSNRLPWHYLPTWIIATTPLSSRHFCWRSFFSIQKRISETQYIFSDFCTDFEFPQFTIFLSNHLWWPEAFHVYVAAVCHGCSSFFHWNTSKIKENDKNWHQYCRFPSAFSAFFFHTFNWLSLWVCVLLTKQLGVQVVLWASMKQIIRALHLEK